MPKDCACRKNSSICARRARSCYVLILLAHTPVITRGRNAKAANVLASAEVLAARGVEVFECDRGGDVTFHGPGQIVGYPIFDLRGFSRQPSAVSHQENLPSADMESLPSWRKTLGAVDYVRRLEEVLILTCADFGIASKRVAGLTGVWTHEAAVDASQASVPETGKGPSTPQRDRFADRAVPLRMTPFEEAKIAAIGVHISRGSVTSHGFALNVNTDLRYFDLIVPCGITAKQVTSMKKELGQELDLDEVAHSLSRNFGAVFGQQMLWVETLDALLGNTVGLPMKAPSELRVLWGQDELHS